MKGIPDAITGLLEKKAVNTALGSKKIQALEGLGATVSGTMTKMSDKVDEVMGSIKKAIKKHGDEAASSVDEVTEVVADGAKYLDSPSEVQQILNKMPELTGTNREKLLSVIQDGDLNQIANELYRPAAEIGDGGTAMALMDEFYSGGTANHFKKAQERLIGLNRIVEKGNLSLNDLDIAEALITDLENALKLFN